MSKRNDDKHDEEYRYLHRMSRMKRANLVLLAVAFILAFAAVVFALYFIWNSGIRRDDETGDYGAAVEDINAVLRDREHCDDLCVESGLNGCDYRFVVSDF